MDKTTAKNAAISERIIRQMETGKDIRQAIDAVFGPGSWTKIANELYDRLREKAKANGMC
jgi:hypothetical protein